MRLWRAPLILVFGACLSGCSLFHAALEGTFEKPKLTFKGVTVQDASLSGMTLQLAYHLENPNAVAIEISELDYALAFDQFPVLSGKPPQGLTIPASSGTDLLFPAQVRFKDLGEAVSDLLSKDTVKYRVTGHVGVKTPVGILNFPLEQDGDIEVPKLPAVDITSSRVSSLTLGGATLELTVLLTNRNSYPLPIRALKAQLDIGGVNIAAVDTGEIGPLPPKAGRTLTLPVAVRMDKAVRLLSTLTGQVEVSLHGEVVSGAEGLPFSFSQKLTLQR